MTKGNSAAQATIWITTDVYILIIVFSETLNCTIGKQAGHIRHIWGIKDISNRAGASHMEHARQYGAMPAPTGGGQVTKTGGGVGHDLNRWDALGLTMSVLGALFALHFTLAAFGVPFNDAYPVIGGTALGAAVVAVTTFGMRMLARKEREARQDVETRHTRGRLDEIVEGIDEITEQNRETHRLIKSVLNMAADDKHVRSRAAV